MWNKNVTDLDAKEIAESQAHSGEIPAARDRYCQPALQSRLARSAPLQRKSAARPVPRRLRFQATGSVAGTLHRAGQSNSKPIASDASIFGGWTNQAPYRAAINDKLRAAAETCAKSNLILLLENEMACNTATGEESAAVLKAIPNKNFMLNWDPGNAAAIGSTPYPDGYRLLPHDRIGHCHAKDVVRPAGKKYEWAPVGAGVVDWVGQFRALAKDGYHYAVSLETHWRGAGTPEASTRVSMKGLKSTLSKAGLNC